MSVSFFLRVYYMHYYENIFKGDGFMKKENRCKQFIKEYKTEISLVIGTTSLIGVAILGVNYYNLKQKYETVADIANELIDSTVKRNTFEYNKIQKSIEDLKPSTINTFDRIPKKKERMFDLMLENEILLKKKDKIK